MTLLNHLPTSFDATVPAAQSVNNLRINRRHTAFEGDIYRVIKSLCALDDYSTKNTQKYFKQFQSLTMIT
jgi:hypothetical protein